MRIKRREKIIKEGLMKWKRLKLGEREETS